MKTVKVLNLGAALLVGVVWLAVPALAEDEAPAAPEAAQAAPVAEVPAEVAEAAPSPDVEGAVVEDAAVAAAEVPADGAEAPAAEAAEATPGEAEVAATEADPAEGAPEPATEAPTGHTVELGAVGYDDSGRPGRIHVVTVGDTLWDVSDAYLGTPWVWPSIWQDNQDIENPHLIHPGDRIWITPTEMRRVTDAQAAALLAGMPASADGEPSLQVEEAIEVPAEAPLEFPVPHREIIGLLDTEQIEGAASIVSPVNDQVMLSQLDNVYISLGEGETEVGDQFTAFETREAVFDPDTGDYLGHHVEFHGWMEVIEVGKETSIAEIKLSATEIYVGDQLVPRPPRIDSIPMQPGPQVEGRVSFLPQSRTLVATDDFVYLNRGSLDGLEIGSPLVVYRPGFQAFDTIRQGDVHVDDRVVADLIVVRVRDESAVAFVRHSEKSLETGDYFRGASN